MWNLKAANVKIVETIKRNIKRIPLMQNIFGTINEGADEDTIDWIDISFFKGAISNLENEGLIYSEEGNDCYYIKNQNASYTNGTTDTKHAMNKLSKKLSARN